MQHNHGTVTPPTANVSPIHSGIWRRDALDATASAAERGRHYLKVTLPSIPVVAFTITFLLVDVLVRDPAMNPAPALLIAGIVTIFTSALCVMIYAGFLHTTGLNQE
jgi:hypothetical protein